MNRIARLFIGMGALVAVSAVAGPLQYSIVPNFFDHQPQGKEIGACHGGVVIDKKGDIYVTTDTDRGILVYGSNGKFKRSFGPNFIHGLELRAEKEGEFIYAARPNFNEVIKLDLQGKEIWKITTPMEAGIFKDAKGFRPCAVTVTPDGSIFAADGYGSNYILKFDKNRKFVKAFGGPGTQEGKFQTCHGIGTDTRSGKPLLLVCNRNSNRVEHWDLDGNFIRVIQKDLRMPAAVHIRGNLAVFPELEGRVTVIDKKGNIAAQVGDNPVKEQWKNYGLGKKDWKEGICNSPHGASIDKNGNLIVSEWSAFGHLHKFKKE